MNIGRTYHHMQIVVALKNRELGVHFERYIMQQVAIWAAHLKML